MTKLTLTADQIADYLNPDTLPYLTASDVRTITYLNAPAVSFTARGHYPNSDGSTSARTAKLTVHLWETPNHPGTVSLLVTRRKGDIPILVRRDASLTPATLDAALRSLLAA